MRQFLAALLLAPLACAAQPLADARQLAADQGCYNCHGEPPRRYVPSFREIVARYATYRGRLDGKAEQALVDRLHHGSLFSHVAAHERLTEEQARALVRWLVEGAP
ncbi:c-type cytochrome [Ramlibacter sp. USB13]|uniref:C-type cytochrome n=1 Tax=Ramlibacter cellulosilyticus TaxID=2764187 RepID=A0A923MQS0_9BURK|nr:c-type cytochrome [Ramlibacter cellulosilyticus]MBC5783231.1 c-type cytochrome [Ramlibacter cellulosilyticus]